MYSVPINFHANNLVYNLAYSRLTVVTRKSSFPLELTKIVENLSNCSGLLFIRSVASNIQTAMHDGEPILEAFAFVIGR